MRRWLAWPSVFPRLPRLQYPKIDKHLTELGLEVYEHPSSNQTIIQGRMFRDPRRPLSRLGRTGHFWRHQPLNLLRRLLDLHHGLIAARICVC
jgi:hypothetical protein